MTRLTVVEGFTADAPDRTWTGPAPRLAVADEFAAYATDPLGTEGDEFGYVYVRANPTPISAPFIDVTIQCTSPDPLPYFGIYLSEYDDTADAGANLLLTEANSRHLEPSGSGVWTTRTFHLTAGVDYDKGAVEAALSAGLLAVLAWSDLAVDDQVWHISQLVIDIGGDVYLRNFPRDDGLGNSAPRNYPRSSRQRSVRDAGGYF